jgi:spermidine/putrescine-binding protein
MKKREINRRDFLKYAGYAATIGGGMFVGGGIPRPRIASAKTKFTIAMSGGSWGDAHKKVFVEGSGFRRKHDLEMEYFHQIDSVVVAQAMSHRDKPIFDVIAHAHVNSAKLQLAGVGVPELDFNIVTNWPDIYPQARMGKYFAAYCIVGNALTYNTKHVKRPESYKDMWNPKYKGHVGIMAYGWNGKELLHSFNKFFGGTEDNVMPGIEAFADLMKKQKPIVVENTEHAMNLFRQGELWIMPFWDGRTRQLMGQGVPVDYVWPKGWFSVPQGITVLKNTKVPKICMDFVNVTLDPDAQVEFMKIFKYSPANRKCKFPKGMEHLKIPEEALEKAANIDWMIAVRDTEKNLELWNKHVLGV